MPFFQQCLTTTLKKQWQECESLVAGIVSSYSVQFKKTVNEVVDWKGFYDVNWFGLLFFLQSAQKDTPITLEM